MHKLYSDTMSLGDNLDMTALLNYTHCDLYLPDVPQCHEQAPIFWGLTNSINFYSPPFYHNPEPQILAQKCFRILKAHGLEERVPAIPVVKLKQSEIDWAKDFLKDYKNPFVIKPYSRAGCIRTPSAESIKKIMGDVSGDTALNFGHSKFGNHVSIPGAVDILDLDIRQLAACFHVIGLYVGADTGDYHLMLAVGGSCCVLCPADCPEYRWEYFHYKPSYFMGHASRVRYMDFNKI